MSAGRKLVAGDRGEGSGIRHGSATQHDRQRNAIASASNLARKQRAKIERLELQVSQLVSHIDTEQARAYATAQYGTADVGLRAELGDRLSCIAPVLWQRLKTGRSGDSETLPHSTILRRNVAEHAFCAKGGATMSAAELRRAQTGFGNASSSGEETLRWGASRLNLTSWTSKLAR